MPDDKKPTKKPRAAKDIPNAPKEGRPGHHGGGWLKTGNTVGVGRKPSEIRGAMLDTLDKANSVMESILDGEFKVEVRNAFGELVGYRPANFKEFTTAWKALADHALPSRSELSGPGGGPIPFESASLEADAMLDRMSEEDLEAYKAIIARVRATALPE